MRILRTLSSTDEPIRARIAIPPCCFLPVFLCSVLLTPWPALAGTSAHTATAQTLSQAQTLFEQGLNEPAIQAAQAILETAENNVDTREAYRLIGRAYTKMAQYELALEALTQAQTFAQQAQQAREEGLALVYIGDVYERRKNHTQAMAHYVQALVFLERMQAWPEARRAWLQIGDIEVARADYDAGLKAYTQALDFARKTKDPAAITENIDYLGYAYRKLGDSDKAQRFHRDAVAQAKSIRALELRNKSLARSYNHLGLALRGSAVQARGQDSRPAALRLLQQARSAEREALHAAQVTGDRIRQGYVLRAASQIERELAELFATPQQQAQGLRASLAQAEHALRLGMEMQNPEWQGLALHSIGIAQARLAHWPAAEASFTHAISLWQRIGDRNALGYAHSLYASEILVPRAQPEQARVEYLAAETAFSSIQAEDELSGVYFKIGSLAERLGQIEQARDYFLRSIDSLERIRSRLSAEDSRLAFFGGRQAPYEALLRLLARSWKTSNKAADIELAFEISERARGRTLLEIMSRASLFRHAGLEPALLAQEQVLDTVLNSATEALRRPHTPAENAALVQQRESAAQALAQFNQTLKQSHPAYAYLRNPQPLSAADVRAHALSDGQALLEYFIGEHESYVFVLLSDGTLSLHILPITRINLLRKIKQLRAPFETIKATGSLDTLASFDAHLAHELYRILYEPIQQSVLGARILLVVPHGPLFYLPLEMLVTAPQAPGRAPRKADTRHPYLIETAPPMRYALSASLLNPLLSQSDQASNTRVLAFMDPAIIAGARGADLALPAAKRELAGLRKVYGERLKVYTEQSATKREFLANSPRYGTLILSAHGAFDEVFPQRSGILLAGTLAQENWLRVQDVLGLRLQAGLVSLGVCEVGLGRIQDGEGLLGFTRAWQYAGAKRLLVTLWSVEDNATAEISVAFHQRQDAGETTTTALRNAKLALLRSQFQQGGLQYRRSNPFFWAPFVLY